MADITVEELHERMKKNEKLIVVDVREVYEYEEFNINAMNIPLGELPSRMNEISDDKDAEIIVHCRSGARSNNAKFYLMENGFTNVRNLLGGMLAWQSTVND